MSSVKNWQTLQLRDDIAHFDLIEHREELGHRSTFWRTPDIHCDQTLRRALGRPRMTGPRLQISTASAMAKASSSSTPR